MKQLLGLLVSLVIIIVTWASVEGGYAVYHWQNPQPTITRQLLVALRWFRFDHATIVAPAQPQTPPLPVIAEGPLPLPDGSTFENTVMQGAIDPDHYIQSWDHLDAWIPILAQAGYLLGSDLNEREKTHSTTALREAGGQDTDYVVRSPETHAKMSLIPNIKFSVASIRGFYGSNIWTQPVLYGPWPGTPGNPDAKKFIDRYALPMALTTTTEDGFRTTLPVVKSDRVILVIGDSITFGALVDDAHTLPSFLQQHYPDIRVINAGIASSQSDDNYLRLESLLTRFKGKVEGVVYVHFENDFFSGIRPGVVLEPRNAVAPLKNLLDKFAIKHSVYVVQASVYVTCPDISRPAVKDYNEKIWRHETVVALAKQAGFITLDSRDLVQGYANQSQSIWASLALYTDHSHLSITGNQYYADAIAATDWLKR